jgi:hypothetical protein
VFDLQAAEAAQQGAWNLSILALREIRDLPLALLSAHFHADGGRMRSLFPSTSDQASWSAALLSLLPFLIGGPVRIIVGFQPAWLPGEFSQDYFWFLLVTFVMTAAGLLWGAAKKFPRWAYPYPIYLSISFSLLMGFTANRFHWSDQWHNSFFPFLAAVLILLVLPRVRSFYYNISQDATLLSYGFYALVLYLLSSVDYDTYYGVPRTDIWVLWHSLLPATLALLAALAHLRIRSAFLRLLALLAGMLVGLVIWLFPMIWGMISVWIGVIYFWVMLLGYGILLTAILLAPMLVTNVIHFLRSPRALH